jgi:hypothetical protein
MSDQTETDPDDFSFGFVSGISAQTKLPFVNIHWGDRMAQVPPFIARQLGQQAFQVAEAAESDAAVFHMLTEGIGLDEAGAFVAQLRDARDVISTEPEVTFAFRETGIVDEGAAGGLPDKVKGEHRFMVAASYSVSPEAISTAFAGESLYLDHESRFALVIGCYDCEQDYDACKDQPCLGDPADK